MVQEYALPSEIQCVLAADYRSRSVNPDNDQIWELNTLHGEPPGIALFTTYGLRAYGMRLFPRFVLRGIPYFDPHRFSSRPVLEFSAANFAVVKYSPFPALDVQQKVWVPDSQTLVGQVTLTNTTSSLLQMSMEWVAQLNPLFSGSPMTAAQISVNTVLQGQTGNLFPVFFLTGGPRGDMTAYPSLGIEIGLPAQTNRQFSWALASQASIDASFYGARKATAYSLDNEQIKIGMQQKADLIDFDFQHRELEMRLQQSQIRLTQLMLPAFREFESPFYVARRTPDQGFSVSDQSHGILSDWGILRLSEIFEVSRMALPANTELVQGLLQNLLIQQGDAGTIFAQSSWNGPITRLPALPLLASLTMDVYEITEDREWLKQVFRRLIRGVKNWFDIENDRDGDGWPEYRHLLQSGLIEGPFSNSQRMINMAILVQTAEWPSLAALLLNECRALINAASILEDLTELEWLEERIERLTNLLQSCWDESRGTFQFRDLHSHDSLKGVLLHSFRQNGTTCPDFHAKNGARLCLRFQSKQEDRQPVTCKIKGVSDHHTRTVLYETRRFQDINGTRYWVTEESFTAVKEIVVAGMKKGDQFSVEIPDFQSIGEEFMLPLWAGVPSPAQAAKMVEYAAGHFSRIEKNLPLLLKIMWIEALDRYGFNELACRYFQDWFFESVKEESNPSKVDSLSTCPETLFDLIPIQTLLRLLGIRKISENELKIDHFNQYFPKVNVKYKRFLLELSSTQVRVQNLNGEVLLFTQPGPQRIVLS